MGSWVLVGIMFRGAVERNEFEFDNYKTVGHGCYLLDSNRWSYSDHDEDYNCKPLGFEYSHNDIVKVEIFNDVIRFSKMAFGWEEEKFELPYTKRENDEMVFCLGIKGEHTELTLV